VLQGLDGYGLSTASVHALLSEVASAAAYHSLLVGELPAMQQQVSWAACVCVCVFVCVCVCVFVFV